VSWNHPIDTVPRGVTISRGSGRHGRLTHFATERPQHEPECECISLRSALRHQIGQVGDFLADKLGGDLSREKDGDLEEEHGGETGLYHGFVDRIFEVVPAQ
jgi:hypothetical protein